MPTPPVSVVRERRRAVEEDEEDDDASEEEESPVRRSKTRTRTAPQPQPDQVIAGVPNELLLPGAIVTLAVVIAGVFTVSRMSNR